ncbi:MAG: chemotaxis protein CheD [candidate division NC10 bacterium]
MSPLAGGRLQPAAAPVAPEKEVTIYIGGVHASAGPAVIKTLLGSCISVCLYDPVRRVGGMNHFMLPRGAGSSGADADATRFGVHAMDCLIGDMMKLGADRRRLVAKFFGAAHVLNMKESAAGVPQQNIAFIREFLKGEGFPILAEDVGGYHPRHVRFYSHTARAMVKRVDGPHARARLVSQEDHRSAQVQPFGDVTLFDQ